MAREAGWNCFQRVWCERLLSGLNSEPHSRVEPNVDESGPDARPGPEINGWADEDEADRPRAMRV